VYKGLQERAVDGRKPQYEFTREEMMLRWKDFIGIGKLLLLAGS
jgi:hypothetical protein